MPFSLSPYPSPAARDEASDPAERKRLTAAGQVSHSQRNKRQAGAPKASAKPATHILAKAGLANRTQVALLAHDAGLA
jgi:hypothetical protein